MVNLNSTPLNYTKIIPFISDLFKKSFLLILLFLLVDIKVCNSSIDLEDNIIAIQSRICSLQLLIPLEKDENIPNALYRSRKFGLNLYPDGRLTIFPAKRKGGVGPKHTIEVSMWTKSLKKFNKLDSEKIYNFVYDINCDGMYIADIKNITSKDSNGNYRKYKEDVGHELIAGPKIGAPQSVGGIRRVCGGSIQRLGDNFFRSDENSGHYGCYWTDERRFQFLSHMGTLGINLIHQPWMLDVDKQNQYPNLFQKTLNFEYCTDEEMKNLSDNKNKIFLKLSNDELQEYQDAFIRSKLTREFAAECIDQEEREVTFFRLTEKMENLLKQSGFMKENFKSGEEAIEKMLAYFKYKYLK